MRLILAMVIAAAMMALSASAALAGEITGNGTLKPVNGNPFFAYCRYRKTCSGTSTTATPWSTLIR